MIETLTEPQGIQDIQSLESETVLHTDHELLVPIAEYASRENLSRRTVDRYVQIGRLEKVKQHGQTFIVDKPLKPPAQEMVRIEKVSDSQIVPFAHSDWVRFGFLQARSKSKSIWQTYAIALTVLFVAVLLASLWLFAQLRFLTSM